VSSLTSDLWGLLESKVEKRGPDHHWELKDPGWTKVLGHIFSTSSTLTTVLSSTMLGTRFKNEKSSFLYPKVWKSQNKNSPVFRWMWSPVTKNRKLPRMISIVNVKAKENSRIITITSRKEEQLEEKWILDFSPYDLLKRLVFQKYFFVTCTWDWIQSVQLIHSCLVLLTYSHFCISFSVRNQTGFVIINMIQVYLFYVSYSITHDGQKQK
jgi:hypothetical protein